jgi:hypothetical protein
MILEALRHGHSLGASGLDPAGLLSYIRGRYWPNAPTQAVGPIAWRMWKKDGTLEKHGSLYAIPAAQRQQSGETDADAAAVETKPSVALPASNGRQGVGLHALAHTGATLGVQKRTAADLWAGTSSVALTHYDKRPEKQ